MEQNVTIFKSYPFKRGQKIYINDSKRQGDWEVIDVSDTKVTLKCPVSHKEVCWDRFCYFVEDKSKAWPDFSHEEKRIDR